MAINLGLKITGNWN